MSGTGEFDFIVVGAGSAGGMLVYRLSESGAHRVLLLEAGGSGTHWTVRMPAATRQNFNGGPRNWCFETDPEPHMANRRIFQPRGKVLGGSSSLNGMVYVRGHRMDYDGWAESGAPGWAYEDVLPWFKSLESYAPGADAYRGGTGPVSVQKPLGLHRIEQAFLEASVQAGHPRIGDYNGAEQEGVSTFDSNIRGGIRSGTAIACIAPARKRPNVRVETGAHVTRIVLEKGVAVGVEYFKQGSLRFARAAREVILSAGAIQSPQILMLSGIGPASELRAHSMPIIEDLPGVGLNLQDHLEVHVKHYCPPGLSRNRLMRPHRIALIALQWFLFRSGPAAGAPSKVGGFLRTDERAEYPNLQYHFWPYFLEGWSPPPEKDGYCFDVGPLRSESRGRINLRSRDPLAAPRIKLNGLSTGRDMEEFRAGIRMTRGIAARKAFDFCRGPEVAPGPEVVSDSDIDAYVRAHANSAYHPCGTCKMGTDEMAVVDPRLKVCGIERLRVADASVMPRITAGNINAPALMIGERAAALVLEDV